MSEAGQRSRGGDERVALAESILGFEFRDKDLLRTALTHPSHGSPDHDQSHYERLEFLGDSVLGFVMTDHLFRNHPDLPEGRMTKVRATFVSGRSLARLAEELGLVDAVIVGHGAESVRDSHTRSLMADSFEAILAAIYLDQGIERVREFLFRVLTPEYIDETILEECEDDPKNLLQEHTQAVNGTLPDYDIVSIEGPPHHRTFTAQVSVDGTPLGTGVGASKKDAQRRAAREALKVIHGGEPPCGSP